MSTGITEDDLVFKPLDRPGFAGDVWAITVEDAPLAQVVEFAFREPAFRVDLSESQSVTCASRDEVVALLVTLPRPVAPKETT